MASYEFLHPLTETSQAIHRADSWRSLILTGMERTLTNRTNVWLVRHGESTWNVRGLRQGQSDIARLTSRGRHQALRAVKILGHGDIEVVYSSDLQRARQTASLIAAELHCEVLTDRRLRERCFGVAEGSPLIDLAPEWTGIRGDQVIDIDARPAGGESLRDVRTRCSEFLQWLAAQGHPRDVAVVTHGGTLRILRASVTGSGIAPMAWDAVDNATVHRIDFPVPSYAEGSPQPLVPTDGRDQ
jgi:probable phosphoglycerate mutase